MNNYGVIFDFNGTLVFDEPFHQMAWKRLIRKHLDRDILPEEFHGYINGRNGEVTLRYFFGEDIEPARMRELIDEKEETYRQIAREHPEEYRLVAGAEELFGILSQQGIPFGIATASQEGNIRFYQEVLDLYRYVSPEHIMYNDGTVKGKPDPDIYLRAAEKIGMPLSSCLVVEDSKSGIEAALRGGALAVVGIDSMLEAGELEKLGVSAVISDYRGAAEVFGTLARRAERTL